MATYEKEGKDIQAEGEQEHKIRITITSKNCSAIERISNELVKAARDKNLKVKVRLRKTYFLRDFFRFSRGISAEFVEPIYYFRVQSVCQPRLWELPPVRLQMVKVPRPGTDTKWESTSVLLIFNLQPRLFVKSLNSQSIQVWTSKSPSAINFAQKGHLSGLTGRLSKILK